MYSYTNSGLLCIEEEEGEEEEADQEEEEQDVITVVYFWEGRHANGMGWLHFTHGSVCPYVM